MSSFCAAVEGGGTDGTDRIYPKVIIFIVGFYSAILRENNYVIFGKFTIDSGSGGLI
jgi:hypothetical protein